MFYTDVTKFICSEFLETNFIVQYFIDSSLGLIIKDVLKTQTHGILWTVPPFFGNTEWGQTRQNMKKSFVSKYIWKIAKNENLRHLLWTTPISLILQNSQHSWNLSSWNLLSLYPFSAQLIIQRERKSFSHSQLRDCANASCTFQIEWSVKIAWVEYLNYVSNHLKRAKFTAFCYILIA